MTIPSSVDLRIPAFSDPLAWSGARKRTCEPCRDGYGAMDVLWPITPIKTASFKRPAGSHFPNNSGEIRCERSSGERCTNWGSNGSRHTVRRPKDGSSDCLQRCRIAW